MCVPVSDWWRMSLPRPCPRPATLYSGPQLMPRTQVSVATIVVTSDEAACFNNFIFS